jgi:type I restriction enzyme S subunit
MTRPNLNAVAKVTSELDGAIASTGFDVLRSRGVEPKWLFAHVQSKAFIDSMSDLVRGALYPAVNSKEVRDYRIPLPPLPEQRRIVAKIEALQARSRKAREALEAIPTLLEQFRQSVLAAAFRGDLTADWREQNHDAEPASVLLERIRAERRGKWEQAELAKFKAKGKVPKDDSWKKKYVEPEPVDDTDLPELPEGWCWTTWEWTLSFDEGAFKRGPFGSSLTKAIFVSSGYKVYEQYCPINDDCSYARYYITPEKYEEMRAFDVRARDFLISCSGVTLGRITQVPDQCEPGIINQALLRVRLNEHVLNDEFFKWLFRSPYFQRKIFDNATGSAIPNVKGVKELKAIPVPVPPLNEQRVIAERVKQSLKSFREMDSHLHELVSELMKLHQSILAKAFRGELVPQDPNDEPASVLLERLRAERATADETKPNRLRRQRNSKATADE